MSKKNLQKFIEFILDEWIPAAEQLEKIEKIGGYQVQTSQEISFTINEKNVFLGTQSKVPKLKLFCEHLRGKTVVICTGTTKKPNTEYSSRANGTIWFKGSPPENIKEVDGYWRISGVWLRPEGWSLNL